jgi:hypothetical protein
LRRAKPPRPANNPVRIDCSTLGVRDTSRLQNNAADAATRLASVGAAANTDPGIVLAHASWLRKGGQSAAARALLAQPRPFRATPLTQRNGSKHCCPKREARRPIATGTPPTRSRVSSTASIPQKRKSPNSR